MLIYYVIYNIASGFPTVRRLYDSLFNLDSYNKAPIDYRKMNPLSVELEIKANALSSVFDGYFVIYLIVALFSLLLFAFSLIYLYRIKRLKEFRLYFLSFLVFLVTVALICVSPKAQRAGHFVYVLPAYQIGVVSILFAWKAILASKKTTLIIYLILAGLLFLNVFVSGREVLKISESNGHGLNGPAIFALHNYIKENNIEPESLVFIEWGFSSQLYFLNKGEFSAKSLIFKLFGKPPQEQKVVLHDFFMDGYEGGKYFPVYEKHFSDTKNTFLDYVQSMGGRLCVVQNFYEKNGMDKAMILYEIEDAEIFYNKVARNVFSNIRETLLISIDKIGVTQIDNKLKGRKKAIWVITKGSTENSRIVLDGVILKTFIGTDVLTAEVPLSVIHSNKMQLEIKVCDIKKQICSQTNYLERGKLF